MRRDWMDVMARINQLLEAEEVRGLEWEERNELHDLIEELDRLHQSTVRRLKIHRLPAKPEGQAREITRCAAPPAWQGDPYCKAYV